jgi:DNA-binding transcriptional regulator GbsR (MarR family)
MNIRPEADSSTSAVRSGVEECSRVDAIGVTSELSAIHWEIIDVCVRSAQVLGLPRSIGEIFGLIFCSPRPVSFDDVVRILRLSNGTASCGLRYLKRRGAVRICYVARERKDFYVAETSLRKIMSAVFSEDVVGSLGGSAERLEHLRVSHTGESENDSNVLYCIDQMIAWNQQLRRAVIKGFESLR